MPISVAEFYGKKPASGSISIDSFYGKPAGDTAAFVPPTTQISEDQQPSEEFGQFAESLVNAPQTTQPDLDPNFQQEVMAQQAAVAEQPEPLLEFNRKVAETLNDLPLTQEQWANIPTHIKSWLASAYSPVGETGRVDQLPESLPLLEKAKEAMQQASAEAKAGEEGILGRSDPAQTGLGKFGERVVRPVLGFGIKTAPFMAMGGLPGMMAGFEAVNAMEGGPMGKGAAEALVFKGLGTAGAGIARPGSAAAKVGELAGEGLAGAGIAKVHGGDAYDQVAGLLLPLGMRAGGATVSKVVKAVLGPRGTELLAKDKLSRADVKELGIEEPTNQAQRDSIQAGLRDVQSKIDMPPEQPKTEPTAKQPWEMTKEEFSSQPETVFHASSRKGIERLEPSPAQGFGEGIYFGTNRDFLLGEFGDVGRGEIYPARVDLKNPYINGKTRISTKQIEGTKAWKEYKGGLKDPYEAFSEDGKFASDVMKELGYDGVISQHSEYGTETVAFYPDQVRTHRQEVMDALREGKPVPPEVLKDYPDLVSQPRDTTPVVDQQTPVGETQKPGLKEPTNEAKVQEQIEAPQGQSGQGRTEDAVDVQDGQGRQAATGEGVAPPTEPPAINSANRPEDAYSPRRAWIDEDAYRAGLEVLPTPERLTWTQAREEAIASGMDKRAPALVDEVLAKPRSLDTKETIVVFDRMVEVGKAMNDARAKANSATSDGEQMTAANEALRLEDEYNRIYSALRAQGTESGRNLAVQKYTIDENFEQIPLVVRARQAKGADLTPSQRASFERTQEALRQKNAELQKKLEELQAAKPAEDPPWLAALSKKSAEAKTRLMEKLSGGTLRSGLDPTILSDIAIIGAEKIARGAKSAVDFSRAMAKEFAKDWEKLKAHAGEIYTASKDIYTKEFKATEQQKENLKTQRRKLQGDRRAAIDEGFQRAKNRGDTIPGMRRLINLLAEDFVRSGVNTRDGLIDAVHAELKKIDPEISRRQTMDLISGYGDFSPLNKDPVKVKLRELKGEMQQLGKLEDMASGQAPKKTGVERRTPNDEERRLIQRVNEAKKKGGYKVTDPERQLKTSLQSAKTRLKNQISDLEKQISSRQKIVKTKSASPTDAELDALKTRRDALKQQFTEIFGKNKLSNEQRVEIAIRATRKSIADLEKRIAEKDLAPRKGLGTVESQELAKLRRQRSELSKTLEEMREAAGVYDAARIERRSAEIDKQIQEVESYVLSGTLPPAKPKGRVVTSDQLDAKRAKLAELKKMLANSEPAQKQKLQRQIADMERKLKGNIEPPKPKDVKKVSAEVERLQFELDKMRKQARQRIEALRPKTVWQHIAEPFNLARAMITSIDVSPVLRQGGFIGLGHPIRAAKTIPTMLKAFASERQEYKVQKEIEGRRNAPLYARSKLYLAEMGAALSKQEEAFMSILANKIPGVRASARAYVTFLNKLRADTFDTMVETLAKNGQPTDAELRAIANYINVATGRGNLGSMEPAGVALSTIFFAPRYVTSRFQLLAGEPLYRGTNRTRKLIAKEYARYLIGIGTVYGLFQLLGFEVGDDPRSSDFGKIKVGNTRIDPLSGLSQSTVLLSRLATGERKSQSGEIITLRGEGRKFGGDDMVGTMSRFLRSKLSPVFGAAVDIASGEDMMGEPTTPKSVATDLLVPLSMRDIYETMKEQGVPAGTAISLLALFGASVQTYETKPKATPKRPRKLKLGVSR